MMLELEESADEVFDEQVERFFKVLLSTPPLTKLRGFRNCTISLIQARLKFP